MHGRKEYFNQAAKGWDGAYDTPKLQSFLKRFVPSFGLAVGQSVLDVGTGTGFLIPFLLEAVTSKGHVTAIDYAQNGKRLQGQVRESAKRLNNGC